MLASLLLLALLGGSTSAAEPGEIVEPPRVDQWIEAEFPAEALAAGVTEHASLLRVAIDESGTVLDATSLDEDPWGFGVLARDAVLRMRFLPARDAEGPVPATFELRYVFRVEEVVTTTEASSDTVRVEGEIRENGTRDPVGGALIRATWAGAGEPPAGPFETVTDATGAFALRALPAGPWSLLVRGPGHRPLTQPVDVVDGEVASLKLWVTEDDLQSTEITVFGERPRAPEITRRTLSSEEIRRIPGTFGDPVKVIQTLPGAARSPFGTGLLIIRGANPEDSGVYVDGIEVPLIYHLTGTTSVIQPEFVESVDYLPGGYAGRFGRKMAGVIDVQTKDRFDETKVTAGADILDAQVYAQTAIPVGGDPEKKVGLAVGVRRSYIDALLPFFLDGTSFAIKPRYWDYQIKTVAPTPSSRRLSLFVYGFEDLLTVSTPDDVAQGTDRDTQGNLLTRYLSHRVVVRWTEQLRPDLELRVTPSFGVDRTVFGVGDALTFSGGTTTSQLRAELGWKPTPAIEITPGLDFLGGSWFFAFRAPFRLDDLDNPLSERDPIAFDGRGTAWYPDAFLRADLTPLEDRDRLRITPSVRLSSATIYYGGSVARGAAPYRRQAFDPRISGRFEIVDGFAIKASTGLYHQPPQPQESIGLGATPNLKYERAFNSSFGVEHQVSPAIRWDVELFWRDLSRLIDIDDAFSGFGSAPFANVGFGRAYGAEIIARHEPVGRFFGWVSYTLSRSERKARAGADWTPFDFDQTHILSAQGGYDLPYNFGVSAQVQFVSGNPESALDAGVYDVDSGSYNGFRVGPPNGSRLPSFFQTSFRVDKRFVFRSWELATYVDLLNTVRGVNPEFTIYNYDFSQFAYVRGLPFIPNLGLEARVRR
jgi:hypothetical protein